MEKLVEQQKSLEDFYLQKIEQLEESLIEEQKKIIKVYKQ